MSDERIGLFGGSFDPPHCGHLALARAALDELALDRVHWLPAGRPWQKAGRELASPADRAAMVAAAIEGEPRFVLDRRELQRDGPSYTIDSVLELRAEHPHAEFFLLLGQDQLQRLPSWHRWRELLGEASLAVAVRIPSDPQALPTPRELPAAPAPPALQAALPRVRWLSMPPLAVSSTALRARLAAGMSAASLAGTMVPAGVARYIDSHRLYRTANVPRAKPAEPGGPPTRS